MTPQLVEQANPRRVPATPAALAHEQRCSGAALDADRAVARSADAGASAWPRVDPRGHAVGLSQVALEALPSALAAVEQTRLDVPRGLQRLVFVEINQCAGCTTTLH